MTIKILTDSASDISKDVAQDLEISIVPLYINIGSESFLDGVDITREDFYQRLPAMENPPTTSAPGIASFVKAYEDLIEAGATGIVSVHISSSLSNVFNVAKLAAESITRVPIEVIDGGNLSMGTGFLAQVGQSAAAAGKSMEDVVGTIRDLIKRTHTFAILDTLEYLRRSGRLSHFKFRLATMLDIKPIIRMVGGEVKLDLIRTHKKAFQRLSEEVSKLAPFQRLAFVHTNAPMDRVRMVKDRLSQFIPGEAESIMAEVTPVIGSHIGPGAVGVSFIREG